jgi:catechol 2,3-dioxygenase-like lactoylglutathione lyase family enzyme
MPLILDHVDLRVRDRSAATAFYDAFLCVLGAVKREGAEFTTWRIPPPGGALEDAPDNFGIVEDRGHIPGATIVRSLGASDVEMDDGMYGDEYYGVFFEDADGNRLEVCVNG